MLYSTVRFVVEFFRDHEQGNLLGRPARHLAMDLAGAVCPRSGLLSDPQTRGTTGQPVEKIGDSFPPKIAELAIKWHSTLSAASRNLASNAAESRLKRPSTVWRLKCCAAHCIHASSSTRTSPVVYLRHDRAPAQTESSGLLRVLGQPKQKGGLSVEVKYTAGDQPVVALQFDILYPSESADLTVSPGNTVVTSEKTTAAADAQPSVKRVVMVSGSEPDPDSERHHFDVVDSTQAWD